MGVCPLDIIKLQINKANTSNDIQIKVTPNAKSGSKLLHKLNDCKVSLQMATEFKRPELMIKAQGIKQEVKTTKLRNDQASQINGHHILGVMGLVSEESRITNLRYEPNVKEIIYPVGSEISEWQRPKELPLQMKLNLNPRQQVKESDGIKVFRPGMSNMFS